MRLQLVPWRRQLSTFADQQARRLQNGNILMDVFVVPTQRMRQFSGVVGAVLADMA
jgi:hypothetical protein